MKVREFQLVKTETFRKNTFKGMIYITDIGIQS